MTRRIPISRPALGEEEIREVERVIESGMLAQGERVRELERGFTAYVGAKHGVAVSNGTVALLVALQAMGVGPGDEVITTPLTFFATASTILMTGATPVFVDVDPETFNLDPSRVEEGLSDATRAIVPVHLFGHPTDMDPIIKLARERDLLVLEDAAQAHGAEYRGRRVGSLGDAAAFSFYPTKNMTTAEGGMVTTSDDGLAERCRLLRDHGQESKYLHVSLGMNYRMTDLQAAIGIVQLKKLDRMNERRREIARLYMDELGGLEGIEMPVERPWARHAWHLFAVKVDVQRRDRLVEALQARGVDARPSYPMPVYEQPVMGRLGRREFDPLWFIRRGQGFRKLECPNAEDLVRRIVLLPIHPGMGDEDVRYVVGAVKEALREVS